MTCTNTGMTLQYTETVRDVLVSDATPYRVRDSDVTVLDGNERRGSALRTTVRDGLAPLTSLDSVTSRISLTGR